MRLHRHLLKSVFGKAALAAAALGGFLFLTAAPNAQAHDRDDCDRRVGYTDWRIHESLEHRGYYSPEANYWRHERREAYERSYRYARPYDYGYDHPYAYRYDRRYDRHFDRDRDRDRY